MVKIFIFLSLVSLLSGCSREVTESSKISIQLPEKDPSFKVNQLLSAESDTWGLSDPQNFSQIGCYAIFVSAPVNSTRQELTPEEQMLSSGACYDSDNNKQFVMGMPYGLFPAGGVIELVVPSGSARTIRLVGLTSLDATCSPVFEMMSYANHSAPQVISSATLDLRPGDVVLEMKASLANAQRFHRCSGPGGSFGPQPQTVIAPQAPTAILSSLPADPSSLMSLDVTVEGTDVTQFKYKLGEASAVDCSDSSGYSSAFTVATAIVDSLSMLNDGLIELCVVGGNTDDLFQSFNSATSYTWTKDTLPPSVLISNPAPGSYISSNDQASYPVSGTCSEGGQVTIGGSASALAACSGGVWSANLDLTSAGEGSVSISVDMIDPAGNLSAQETRSFIKDTSGPGTPIVSINSGANSTTSTAVNLTLSASDAAEMYITDSADCASGGVWETYISSRGWTLATTNGEAFVYAKVRDSAGNESSCASDSITHGGPAVLVIDRGPSYDFGTQALGTNSVQIFTVTNSGGVDAINITAVSLPAPFSYGGGNYPGISGTCFTVLSAGASCTIEIIYSPTAVGSHSASIVLNYEDGSTTAIASRDLMGTGANPAMVTFSGSDPHDFGNTPTGTGKDHVLTINNIGGFPADSIGPSGLGAPFSFKGGAFPGIGGTCSSVLQPSQSCTIVVTFSPPALISYSDVLVLNFYNGVSMDSVNLNLQGMGVPPPIVFMGLGGSHSCAIDASGSARCWGGGASGQLGNGVFADSLNPAPISGAIDWVNMSSFIDTTCGVDSSSNGYCWGDNFYGQVGDGSTTSHSTPSSLGGGWTKLAVGTGHTCGLQTDQSVLCWGRNDYGQLGDGTGVNRSTPGGLNGGAFSFLDIAAGGHTTCGVLVDNSIRCWGKGDAGQIGNDATVLVNATPTLINSAANYVKVAVGDQHVCALTDLGEIHCWGYGAAGQLGNNAVANALTYVVVPGSDWSKVTAGANHTCGYKNGSNTLWCWGSNAYGQLGDGSQAQRNAPVQVTRPGYVDVFVDVFSGLTHNCAQTASHGLLCWGRNNLAQVTPGAVGGQILTPYPTNP